uniref:Uncharacterized protein n=1 Tax=Anguilla anguilla TaxID=7936 RepID=A0A0E9SEU0_ANGAN
MIYINEISRRKSQLNVRIERSEPILY